MARPLDHALAVPLLTAEEEKQLGSRVRSGDLDARNELVERNIRLAVNLARRYHAPGVESDDLVQAAMFGLMRAADKFDDRKGFRFTTYATWWIRQAIERAISTTGRTVRLPTYIHNMVEQHRKRARSMATDLGREPTRAELAACARLDVEASERLVALGQRVVELDAPLKSGLRRTGIDALRAVVPEPSHALDMAKLLRPLRSHHRLRRVVQLRADGMTLFSVGEVLGVCRERVRQLEVEALAILRGGALAPSTTGATGRCRNGHAWTKRNTGTWPNGARMCRACQRARSSARVCAKPRRRGTP